MNIFNKGFIKTLVSRGEEYYKVISPYKKELKDQKLFRSLNSEDLNIKSIYILDGYGSTFENFNKEYDIIKINYEITEDDYCGGTNDIEYSIELPSWILEEREIFRRKLDDNLNWHRKDKELWDSRIKRADMDNLNLLAKKLGYKIEREAK